MKTSHSITVTAIAIGLSVFGIAALADALSTPASAARPPAGDPGLVKRGDYLVNRVGLCIDCHSPRDERGGFIPGRHLTGAPVAFTPAVPMPAWATVAPPIAGVPAGWSDEAMIRFLTTGDRPNHLPPTRPPMPPYRFNHADAEAVVAYLRSLADPDADDVP